MKNLTLAETFDVSGSIGLGMMDPPSPPPITIIYVPVYVDVTCKNNIEFEVTIDPNKHKKA